MEKKDTELDDDFARAWRFRGSCTEVFATEAFEGEVFRQAGLFVIVEFA